MLKIKFLGVNGSLQENNSGNTSLLICGERGRVVVDLSCNLATIVEADIDAVILTHEHIDHIYALPSLLHQLWISGREKALHLYISEGMDELVNGLIDLFNIRDKKNMFEIKICKENKFRIGDMYLTTFPTDHTAMSIGIIVEDDNDKLIYTCDTRPFNEVPSFMEGAQILIHETSGLQKEEDILLRKGHSSGADAGKLACKLNVKNCTFVICQMERKQNLRFSMRQKRYFLRHIFRRYLRTYLLV